MGNLNDFKNVNEKSDVQISEICGLQRAGTDPMKMDTIHFSNLDDLDRWKKSKNRWRGFFIILFQKVLKHAKYNYLLHFHSFVRPLMELAHNSLFLLIWSCQPISFF